MERSKRVQVSLRRLSILATGVLPTGGTEMWSQRLPARKVTVTVLLFCLISAIVSLCSCARTPEQKSAKFLARGSERLRKHDYARAILEFRSAIQAKPQSAQAYYEMGLAYVGVHDIPTAVQCLRKTLELNPKYTAAELILSDLALATRDPAEVQQVEKHVRKVLENAPANADALDILAKAEWGLGKRQEAEKLLQQAFEQSPQVLRLSADLAQVELWKNDRAAAESILKRAAEQNPESAAAAVILGRFYVVVGRSKDAEQQFERALTLNPDNTGALLSLAAIRWRAGRTGDAEQLYRRVANSPDPELKPVHAMFLFQSGKRVAAISEFEELYRRNPADRSTRTRLITAYEATGRGSDGEKLLAAVLRENPKDVDALLERSALYLGADDATQAQTDLNAVLRFRPDSATAHYLLARVHQMRAESQMEKAELTEALRLDPSFLSARIELAKWLISHQSAKNARDVLNEAPESQKGSLAVLVQLNWAALALGDQVAARTGIDRALATRRDPECLIQDATLRMLQRDYAGTRQAAEEALQEDRAYPEALSLVVQTYEIQKDLPKAIQWLRDYTSRTPKSAPAQFYLGQILMQTGKTQEARSAFVAAKAADPALEAADLNLVLLDMQDRRLDDARKTLSAVIFRKPNDVGANILLGDLEHRASNHQAAIEAYRKAVELDGRNVEALNNLAYALAEDGQQTDEAMKFAQKAGELAPDNATVADTLGWVLYRKALYTLAIPYFERAVSHQPSALYKCHLGLAYIKSGNQSRGREILNAALQMNPGLMRSELSGEVAATQNTAR